MPENIYPDSEVYEKSFLYGLYHIPEIQGKYLMNILPNIFFDKVRRIIIYAMQKLKENGMEVSVDGIYMIIARGDETVASFVKKNKISRELLTYDAIYDNIYDMSAINPKDMIGKVKTILYDYAFTRYVTDKIKDIEYFNSFNGQKQKEIINISRSISKVHEIMNKKKEDNRDQLAEAKDMVNSTDEYISTSSEELNLYIGGWSRGYVGAIIAKSSHTKSTWTDYNAVHTIGSGKVKLGIDIITPEESASTRWRRIIAMICSLSTSKMRQKKIAITDEHINIVKKALDGKLRIHDDVFKMSGVVDKMESLSSDMIILDHLQSVDYPGISGQLNNMIQNIPTIVTHQKRIAKTKNLAIINLSQVGDKEIARSDRLMKYPRYHDAYGSSALYQASREFLSFWYPYKDYEDNSVTPNGKIPTPNDVMISIEKSSFGKIGKIFLNYAYDFATFTDAKKILPKQEPLKKNNLEDDSINLFKK